jgi:IclR family transcriptional regulator, acetate operon repressor
MMDARIEDGSPAVLTRAFCLLDAFDEKRTRMTIQQIIEITAYPKATVYRLATQLVKAGLLERVAGGYQVGLRVFELGQLAAQRRVLCAASASELQFLREQTHRTTHLAVLCGADILCLEKLDARAQLPLASRRGGRTPALASGMGKALLAYAPQHLVREVLTRNGLNRSESSQFERELESVRGNGIAIKGNVKRGGLVCTAAPVLRGDDAIAAISISGWAQANELPTLADAVRSAASQVTQSYVRLAS